MSKISYLHGRPSPIGLFYRVGRQDHRALEKLYAAGKFQPKQVVFSAAWIKTQKDLLQTLHEEGVDIILDPNTAELSSLGRYQSSANTLPWSNPCRPLLSTDIERPEFLQQLAEFAVAHGVNRILAPTIFNPELSDEALARNIATSQEFRIALDKAGGKSIAIDYPLTTRYSAFIDGANRRRCVARFREVAFDRLWLRIGDYRADAPASKIQRYILSASDYCQLRKPIIADMVGGIAALSLPAFGVVSGVCHGVNALQRFDTASWIKAPKPTNGSEQSSFGLAKRTYLPGIDRSLKVHDLNRILQARGARSILLCSDRDCCPHGIEMLSDPRAHFLVQKRKQVQRLEGVPDHRRSKYFVDREMTSISRTARRATKLKLEDRTLAQILDRAAKSIEDKRLVLENLHERADGQLARATPMRNSPLSTRDSNTAESSKL